MRFRTTAAVQAKTRERHRRAHQFQKAATRDFVAFHLRGAGGEFLLEPAAEFRRVAQLTEATPVLLPGLLGRRMFEDAFHR
jgi:hypothetical protein